jgi:hypothetical protein
MRERGSIGATRPWTERGMSLDRGNEDRGPSERRVDTDYVDRSNDINERIVIKSAQDLANAPSTRAARHQHRTRRLGFSSQIDAENTHILMMPVRPASTECRARTTCPAPAQPAPNGIYEA